MQQEWRCGELRGAAASEWQGATGLRRERGRDGKGGVGGTAGYSTGKEGETQQGGGGIWESPANHGREGVGDGDKKGMVERSGEKIGSEGSITKGSARRGNGVHGEVKVK